MLFIGMVVRCHVSDTARIDLTLLQRSCGQCSLRELCLPAGIPPADLKQLEAIVKKRRPVERDGRLFRVGDPMHAVYVARKGAFKTVAISEDGEEQVIGFHLPGELIGLDALGSGVHRCEAVALNVANVCEVPFGELSHVAAQIPGLQQQLLRVIGQSVGRDQQHMELLSRRQASERIALFLHGFGERLRNGGQSGIDFKLPMSREDIARFLGLAFETVSRGFTRLQEDDLILIDGRRITLLDVERLDRVAHGVAAAKVTPLVAVAH